MGFKMFLKITLSHVPKPVQARVKYFNKFSKFHKFSDMDVSHKNKKLHLKVFPKFAVFMDPLIVIIPALFSKKLLFGVIT